MYVKNAGIGFYTVLLYLLWVLKLSANVADQGVLRAFVLRARFVHAGWGLKDIFGYTARADENAAFHRRLMAKPSMLDAVVRTYQSTHWDSRTRLTKLSLHYRTMAKLHWLFDPHDEQEVTLCTLDDIHEDLRLVIDEAAWFRNEGPLVISLFLGADRIFSIAFALREEDDMLTAYVGALQGVSPRTLADILDIYRRMTRLANGVRPRDLLIELFRMFCAHLGVSRIFLVADKYQQRRDPYFGARTGDVLAHYDDVWLERGAVPVDEATFELPLRATLRAPDQIPSRKRALYRRRYDMLAGISGAIARELEQRADRA